jgi:hypothetical protein
MPEPDPFLGDVVVAGDELRNRVAELGAAITADYQGRAPLLVGVLKGAFMFMADLARSIKLPVEFDFMAVSSYGSATRTSGVVRIVKDLEPGQPRGVRPPREGRPAAHRSRPPLRRLQDPAGVRGRVRPRRG